MFGNSIQSILSASHINKKGKRVWEYEPVGKSGGLNALPAPNRESMQAALAVVQGKVPDPTHGATFFQNSTVTRKRGTHFDSPRPPVKIGDHDFHHGYGSQTVQVPQNIVMAYLPKGKGLDGTTGQNAIHQAMEGGHGSHRGPRRHQQPKGFADRYRRARHPHMG